MSIKRCTTLTVHWIGNLTAKWKFLPWTHEIPPRLGTTDLAPERVFRVPFTMSHFVIFHFPAIFLIFAMDSSTFIKSVSSCAGSRYCWRCFASTRILATKLRLFRKRSWSKAGDFIRVQKPSKNAWFWQKRKHSVCPSL